MMGNASLGLIGLACVVMMALMCLPMALGMLHGWWRRRHPNRALAAPTAPTPSQKHPVPAAGGSPAVHG